MEPLIDTIECAKLLGIAAKTLEDMRSKGVTNQPPWVKVGHSIRYRPSKVAQWLESQERTRMRPEDKHVRKPKKKDAVK